MYSVCLWVGDKAIDMQLSTYKAAVRGSTHVFAICLAFASLSAKRLSVVCKVFIKFGNTAISLCYVRVVTYHDASSHSHTHVHILHYIFHTQAKDKRDRIM